MPELRFNPNKLPALVDHQTRAAISLGDDLVCFCHTDPRVNQGDVILLRLFTLLANIEGQIHDIRIVLTALPGCGRPIELPSLFQTTDAARDALTRIHDIVDAVAAAQKTAPGREGDQPE